MQITFIGAVGTVTGSKTLIEADGTRVLVDCGMFQGVKTLRLRNWRRWPFEPNRLDAVVLTHAHIDHTGLLPRLVADHYNGPIHCTPPTESLCEILLPDGGRIQEEDARYLNKKGLSKHKPALPLYTEADARQVLKRLKPHPFDQELRIGAFRIRFKRAGHILGAATLMLETPEGTLCISGDLGHPDTPLMTPPEDFEGADWLVLESTYGDRLHPDLDPIDELEPIVRRAVERSGVLVIPGFAVDRAQTHLDCLHAIFQRDESLRVPVYLDSPMATDVTELYEKNPEYHRLNADEIARVCRVARIVNTVRDSQELNDLDGPMIIVSASGMVEGGRVVHHIKAHGSDSRNMICLSGYQAPGTRGADLAAGAKAIKIHGSYVPIHAEVAQLRTLSAHADQTDLLEWASGAARPPRTVFVVHGEPVAADVLRRGLAERLGCPVTVPEYRETVELDDGAAG